MFDWTDPQVDAELKLQSGRAMGVQENWDYKVRLGIARITILP